MILSLRTAVHPNQRQVSADPHKSSARIVFVSTKTVLCDGVNDCGNNFDESADYCNQLKVTKCTFEPTQKAGSCNWTQESDLHSSLKWKIQSSGEIGVSNLIGNTGPLMDHTFRIMKQGYFLYLTGLNNDYGKKTRFYTQFVKAMSGQSCTLRVFYYMFGADVGSLSIYVQYFNPSIKSIVDPLVISGDKGQQWIRAILTNTDVRLFRFVIEGQLGIGPQSDIAIDDISFSEGCDPSDQQMPTQMPTTIHSRTTDVSTVTVNSSHTSVTPTKSSLGNSDKDSPKSNGISIKINYNYLKIN